MQFHSHIIYALSLFLSLFNSFDKIPTKRLAHFIPAALLFVAGYAGCQALGAAWLGIAALLVSGTAPAGALAAIADLAPAESPACAAAACALCSTLGAAGLLAANYFVTQALHGSVSQIRVGRHVIIPPPARERN